MRVVVLSDHGGEQLRHTEERLRAAGQDLHARQRSYRIALDELQAARRQKPLWRRIFGVSTTAERDALARARQSWNEVEQVNDEAWRIHGRAQQQAAGAWGEEALTQALSVLSDDWLDLCGYRNRKGETDHLLVGPTGLWAVEVKRQRVRINAVGDQWWFDKLDSWGNTVGTGWAVDRGGRSWARQATDVADDLAAWLARNGYRVPIRTAVMVMHERAVIGRCEQLTV